ncbi:hypothetical protein J7W19_10130 [Streptomyces mobaraensis NBRC 13819 = DSM 40847]|uniref:Uncharacterized protein n=1 Tax=Streptomyces mobaraensis (strain ATCC 29032 / DSM 40847 / JCM 4168 / NBRC 13819 / NCIMB 11159 / IPCR 16-22) TaxID=1223523 RepID=M3B1G0_STRM1|nr:hypothetical protein [Streptomyces mobaraensis]EME99782.1 hypothetical protein H340_14606 [Streptomyces mobaraensis NBRC 13819 = DSM 40847]QTT73731.1 hypothetical protein J7W19_10130 [Streptomyces mobaraensis NBRC 13819 = DSM 40847]
MPLVEITYAPHVLEDTLRELREKLPHLVSLAVECPEEPYDGDLRPGDVELRFRPLGPLDSGGMDVVVEVRSKWFASRAADRQERADRLCAGIRSASGLRDVGVYLSLPVAAWAQGE